MKYKLTVIAYDNNENYEKELAEFKDRSRMGWGLNHLDEGPQPTKIEKSLEVVLTEDEFKKVKESVIEGFR